LARWETTPMVLRIFDPQLARSVKDSFGFTMVRSTAALAAPWFVGGALGLEARTRVLALRRAADKLILEHPPWRNTRSGPTTRPT
jgi:hypothetical protein